MEATKIPVTNFENTALKSSFSLSSLSTPEKTTSSKPPEFNSLKKKRKESLKRLSWGSSASEQQNEFWSGVLEANYNYIMDNQLLDNCQDANCELSADNQVWSLDEFNAQFSSLYSWMNRIQEKIYGSEDNVTNKELRSNCKTELTEKRPVYNTFNEQGMQLTIIHPESKNEVAWRLNRLCSKWDTLESVLLTSDSEENDTVDVQQEVKTLRNWIFEMNARLEPFTFKKRWCKAEMESIANEHKVLHKDIENHGKIVNSVVKLCKRSSDCSLNTVVALERHWHILFLRSLEWQCYWESYEKRKSSPLFCDSEADTDEGPARKLPRLSSQHSPTAKQCIRDKQKRTSKNDSGDSGSGTFDELDGKHTKRIMNSDASFVTPREGQQLPKCSPNARNFGTYFFKHIDTDSDMDKLDHLQNIPINNNERQTPSETSDEDLTYKAAVDTSKELEEKPTHTLMKIREMVQEVEQMVNPINRIKPDRSPINKTLLIRQWLKIKPDDSCDASSEDDENDSESSDELNESIATYRPQTSLKASSMDLGHDSTPKVVLRQRFKNKDKRPSSVSCISQLTKSMSTIEHDNHSISESALHQLPLNGSLNNSTPENNSSSTVDDSSAIANEDVNSPIRRKRFKLKKKSNLRKFEASSPYNGFAVRSRGGGTLVKSGSFSGRSCKNSFCDRHTVSDPSAIPVGQGFETSTTSGADSDEDKRSRRMPVFKIGQMSPYHLRGQNSGDNPLKFANDEQFSSLYEEAWDNYQEKYSSEAYSETHDSDAARKLLEFGEDYRNYLGSQSDWSAQSSQFEFSPQFSRKCLVPKNIIDSDSEAHNLRQLLKDSRNQLKYTENVFVQQQALGLNQFLVNNEMKELLTTCDRHIGCLSPVEKAPEEYTLSHLDKKEFSDLIACWQSLKWRIIKMQEYRELQNEIVHLKRQLTIINIPSTVDALTVNSLEDLRRDIDMFTAELANIEEYKKKLLKINLAVNHFIAENADYGTSSLKSDVSELYRLCYDINNSTAERVNRLNVLLQSWQILETRLDQLRGDLRNDELSLGELDMALQGANFTNKMVSSTRVAKLLSDTNKEGCTFSEILSEGSFSDSGISDEGSEHDIGERERRLSALRRLVRQLEMVMVPDCAARIRMRDQLEAAEAELKTLQNKCRSIIVRTATTPVSNAVVVTSTGSDPDDEPKPSSWFRRVLRASLPFPIAILALIFLACLMEPHCCDNMNSLHFSINPQFHYVRGPPPT